MGIGYLLGGIACLLYFSLVGYFVGIKVKPVLLKIVNIKLFKNMSDKKAMMIFKVAAIFLGLDGIALFIVGAMI